MARRKVILRPEVLPDPVYKDKQVTRFVNILMRTGKKSTAEGICHKAFNIIKAKTGNDPLRVFRQAVDNVRPVVEVKSRRVGGASYQVPVDIRPSRRVSLAHRWIVLYARQRAGKNMEEKLAAELMDASSSNGGAIRKKEDVHRMAEANKAFAHYRW